MRGIKQRAAIGVAGGMLLATVAPAMAQQTGVATGVVAAVVQVDRSLNEIDVLSDIGSIEVITVKDSLNNVLNNSPILSNNVVTLQDFLNNCTVASCFEISDFLNQNDIAISDVVAIDVLSGGLTLFVM